MIIIIVNNDSNDNEEEGKTFYVWHLWADMKQDLNVYENVEYSLILKLEKIKTLQSGIVANTRGYNNKY